MLLFLLSWTRRTCVCGNPLTELPSCSEHHGPAFMHCFTVMALSDNGPASLAASVQSCPGGKAAGRRFQESNDLCPSAHVFFECCASGTLRQAGSSLCPESRGLLWWSITGSCKSPQRGQRCFSCRFVCFWPSCSGVFTHTVFLDSWQVRNQAPSIPPPVPDPYG